MRQCITQVTDIERDSWLLPALRVLSWGVLLTGSITQLLAEEGLGAYPRNWNVFLHKIYQP